MAELTIRYTRKVAGHPEPDSQVTVERTALVEALLEQGYAVEVDPAPTDHLLCSNVEHGHKYAATPECEGVSADG